MSSEEAGHVIQNLAEQAQLLASLHWLSSLQVLACIPQQQSVPIQDVADISGVPIDQLIRSIRVATTAGFLREPLPGYVEHTPLSKQFIRKPFLSDAVAFLCDTALPAAMQMGKATRLQLQSPNIRQSAYNLVSQTSMTLGAECEQQPKLKRQVAAYERLRSQSVDDGATEVLSSLDWTSLGDATVVQVGPRSTATACALVSYCPNLRFIVQVIDPDSSGVNGKNSNPAPLQISPHLASRISTQTRARGAPQPIKDGTVYVVHLPEMFLSSTPEAVLEVISTEIKIHFDVLRANRDANLIIIAQVLPEPGMTNSQVEVTARSQDLLMMQMTSYEMLSIASLRELLATVSDDTARLTVLNQLFSRRGPVVALQVKLEDLPRDRRQSRPVSGSRALNVSMRSGRE